VLAVPAAAAKAMQQVVQQVAHLGLERQILAAVAVVQFLNHLRLAVQVLLSFLTPLQKAQSLNFYLPQHG
jgi:hypothetical protein